MTTARLLPIINAAGCLVLVGFIFFQWFGGKVLNEKLHGMEAKPTLADMMDPGVTVIAQQGEIAGSLLGHEHECHDRLDIHHAAGDHSGAPRLFLQAYQWPEVDRPRHGPILEHRVGRSNQTSFNTRLSKIIKISD